MILENGKIKDIKIFTPKVYLDDRGFFTESYNKFIENALKVKFPQDNHSRSKKNVCRGLHYQWSPNMGKLIRVIKGRGLDVAVDLRINSSTFGQHESIYLSEDNFKIVWIPPGFAHGFLSLEEDTHLTYKASELYNKNTEGSINPLCETLNIDWTIDKDCIILSEKDKLAQSIEDYKKDPKF